MHTIEESVMMFESRIWVRVSDEQFGIGPEDTVIPAGTDGSANEDRARVRRVAEDERVPIKMAQVDLSNASNHCENMGSGKKQSRLNPAS
jgi:hypothetical protein